MTFDCKSRVCVCASSKDSIQMPSETEACGPNRGDVLNHCLFLSDPVDGRNPAPVQHGESIVIYRGFMHINQLQFAKKGNFVKDVSLYHLQT